MSSSIMFWKCRERRERLKLEFVLPRGPIVPKLL